MGPMQACVLLFTLTLYLSLCDLIIDLKFSGGSGSWASDLDFWICQFLCSNIMDVLVEKTEQAIDVQMSVYNELSAWS